MDNITAQRRQFLRMGLTGLGYFLGGGIAKVGLAQDNPAFYSLAALTSLAEADDNGIMLPPGFRSRVVARSSERPVASSDYVWHPSPDGGACFATDDGGWIYVSNSEVGGNAGGVGALRFAPNGEVVDAYPILQGTSVNCAGGATPWGTWLSCEEFSEGQVYECDPQGNQSATVKPALGTFKHEAVAVDSTNGYLYLTEDERDGGLYRFVPANGLPDLSRGRLEIAALDVSPEGNFVRWMPLPDPMAQNNPTRYQIEESHAFAGGEGVALHDGKLFFTTKVDNRVWSLDLASNRLDVIYDVETSSNPILTGVDNVAITPAGDVLVCEDGGDMQIVALTNDFSPVPLLQFVGHERSEICGAAFDPSFRRLYFSSQRGPSGRGEGGITYEISAAV